MPALHHLRIRHPEAEPEPPTRERVESHRRHRGRRRRPAADLHDAGAHVDPRRPPGDPRGGRDRVRAIGLGGPHRIEAEPLGLEDLLHVERHLRPGVAEGECESHGSPLHRRPVDRHAWARRTTRPRRKVTPSASSRIRCVSMLLIRARALIPPCALTTRCHGRAAGHSRSAPPTARAERGRPSSAAIWPYVATRPRGIRRTRRQTASRNVTPPTDPPGAP